MLSTSPRPPHLINASPTPPQYEFLTSDARITAFIAGIGSGKSYAGTLKALGMPPNTTGMIVAPTFDMVKTISVTTMLEIAEPLVRTFNKADLEMTLRDGKVIYFRSADKPDRLRGPNLGWLWLDEARDMDAEAYLISLGRIRLAPEKLWITTTPRPRTWLRDLTQSEGTHAIRASSMTNPHLSAAFIESLEREYGIGSDFYRQEVLGEFVDFAGAVFQAPTRYDELPPGREATGCDFAYTSKSGDWTVFLQGREADGIIYITSMYRAQTDATTWAELLKGYPRPVAFIGGQESGIAAFLRKDYKINLTTERAATDKLSRAQPAAAAWNRGEIRIPHEAPWLEPFLLEISAFTGNPAHDDHDDVVDALAALHHELIGETFNMPGPLGFG